MDGLTWFLIILGLSILIAFFIVLILIGYILHKRKTNKIHINQVTVANSCTDTSSQDSTDIENSKNKIKSTKYVYHGKNIKNQKLFEAPPPPVLTPELELDDMNNISIINNDYKSNLTKTLSPDIKSNETISLSSSRRSIGKRNNDNSIVLVVNDVPNYNPNMPYGIEIGGFSKNTDNINDNQNNYEQQNDEFKQNTNQSFNVHIYEKNHQYDDRLAIRRASSPVSIKSLSKKFEHLLEDGDEKFYEEFELLEKQHPKHATAFSSEETSRRNRFYDIVPFEYNRVLLKYGGGNDYINASYINNLNGERCYISTQGPIGKNECFNGRRDSTITDFWRLIYQEDIDCVVMLTQLSEGLRTKCARYWPENPNEIMYLEYGLSIKFYCLIEDENSYQREFLLYDGSNDPPKKVLQWQYKKWNENYYPDDNLSLLHFIRQIRISPHLRPILVHCSAGVGRSGVYIAIDQLLDYLDQSNNVDIYNVVQNLRQQRLYLIQNIEQYRLIYDIISIAVKQKLGKMDKDELTSLDRNKWLSDDTVSIA